MGKKINNEFKNMSSLSLSVCYHRIVNSELTNMKSALEPLEHITSFGNSLFDIWTVNR